MPDKVELEQLTATGALPDGASGSGFRDLRRLSDVPVDLTVEIDPRTPPTVVGDPRSLRQILLNLAGNAIKFTDQGSVTLTVRVESIDQTEVVLHFRVMDTGIGIPASKQASIFDAFVQADGSSTRRHGGTGLGLAICSNLVNLMGGRIWVESEEGMGSSFHFTARFART